MKYFFNKALYILLFIAMGGGVSGCVTTKGDLPSDYHFNPDSKEGLVILTVSCNLGEGPAWLFFKKAPTSEEHSQDYQTLIDCSSVLDTKVGKLSLRTMDLPEGVYYFNLLQQSFNQYPFYRTIFIDFTPIYFTVLPKKVSYLGRLEIAPVDVNKSKNIRFALLRAENQDIPSAKQKLPFLKNEDIEIKYLTHKAM